MERIFKGRVVVPGEVTLKALVSHGGFNTLASFKDCKEGKNTCTDQNNPDLYGKSTVGVALWLRRAPYWPASGLPTTYPPSMS